MDPWGSAGNEPTVVESRFEDNFVPSVRDTLPDSDQYLATLEKRLRDIKNDPDFLKQLRAKREACLQNLLNGETQFERDDDLDAPVNNSP
ncbi:hypothetical protein TcasGA2_TC006383 [Tribolium castaneum]|uniref:Uncharacterized protein n=1 Tax=Tribolium castaneum TaxID=7070 RepID=D6WWG0_TRICA|nr:hypothetical protein TcasGA2_TC006383 [Tribolium castaneum]